MKLHEVVDNGDSVRDRGAHFACFETVGGSRRLVDEVRGFRYVTRRHDFTPLHAANLVVEL